MRQECINAVPKYGNDEDYADNWAAWVLDTWYDSLDWINTRRIAAAMGRTLDRRHHHRFEYGNVRANCRQPAKRAHLSQPAGGYDVPGTGDG